MDRRQFFGDSVGGTVIRLVLLSIVVGLVLFILVAGGIGALGCDAFHWAFNYFLLGAVVVVPIWFIVRLMKRDPKV